MKTYFFELTDTFGDELNYCWVNRFIVQANSLHGALCKVSKHTGLNFKNTGLHYKASKACIALLPIDYEVNQDWENKAEIL